MKLQFGACRADTYGAHYDQEVIALSHQTGVLLAEFAFLLMVISGIWLVASQLPALKWARFRTVVAGAALSIAGILLIIATHWAHFG